jgi:ribulose-5-phosphate 4-epimerase/fuculose-1-phosphate aldolase
MVDEVLLKMIAPNPGRFPLTPALSPQANLALLARVLFDEGYDDHLAGHISWKQRDGSLLMTPWELTWDEITAADVIRVGTEGENKAKVIKGAWNVTPAVSLHLEIYKRRPDVAIVIHNHPRWSSVYAGLHRTPAIYDQTAAQVNGDIAFVHEYEGTVNQSNEAVITAEALGSSKWAILANHGAVVTAGNIRQAYLRAMTLEMRCRLAWHVQTAGQGTAVDAKIAEKTGAMIDGSGFPFLWEAMVRRALRKDPGILNDA